MKVTSLYRFYLFFIYSLKEFTLAQTLIKSFQTSFTTNSLCQHLPANRSEASLPRITSSRWSWGYSHTQHRCPPGMCALISTLFNTHKWLHFHWHRSCRWHHSYWTCWTVMGLQIDRKWTGFHCGADTTTWNFICKTAEMTVDLKKAPTPGSPLTINGCTVSSTDSFKFLGTTICKVEEHH